jgi:3-oxoadipate enol-lactonase
MGAKAAQLLASQRPLGLEGLILVAPASPFPQHIPSEAMQAQLHAYDNRTTALAAIDFLTARRPAAATLEQLLQDSLGGSQGAKLAWPTSAAYEDISSQVKKIAVPTLILVGDQDRQDLEELQRREVVPLIEGARIEIIPDCGHLIPVDQPTAMASAITTFVNSIAK